MNKSAPRLGRGLSALIGTRESRPLPPTPNTTKGAFLVAEPVPATPPLAQLIAIDRIRPNPKQPRTVFDEAALEELARSIRTNGVLQPILLRTANDGAYELVAGERRWRAARLAGLSDVPAIIRDLTDAETLEVALIENLQREDLGPLERATAYQVYIETFAVTVDQLAGRLAESRANIANYLRLLKLAPEIRTMIAESQLGMGQARAIAGISDQARQLALAKLAARRNLSVRQVEELAKQGSSASADGMHADPAVPSGAARHLSDVERVLSKSLGLRVTLTPGKRKNSGRVIIAYESLDEFDQLATRLGGLKSLD